MMSIGNMCIIRVVGAIIAMCCLEWPMFRFHGSIAFPLPANTVCGEWARSLIVPGWGTDVQGKYGERAMYSGW